MTSDSGDESEIEFVDYESIPNSFPKQASLGVVPGAQPKILATLYNGYFYEQGTSPPEIYERWSLCTDLVAQLVSKALISKEGKRSHMTQVDILKHYHGGLLKTNWTSAAEADWIIKAVAKELNWITDFT